MTVSGMRKTNKICYICIGRKTLFKDGVTYLDFLSKERPNAVRKRKSHFFPPGKKFSKIYTSFT